MISSMTGFGRAVLENNGYTVLVEVRSLNHRFLDTEIRLPRNLQGFEPQVREVVTRGLSRGRVSTTVTVNDDRTSSGNITIDKSLAATYLRLIEDLKQEFNLNGAVNLEQLLGLPDIFAFENNSEPDNEVLQTIKKSVELALNDLKAMRRREGEEIYKDLQSRIAAINKLIKKIEDYTIENAAELFNKLKARIEKIANFEAINEGRLEMEVALLAEKADVTEECIRFQSHNTLFLELLDKSVSEGRKLNFLLQEMHREANTIGAKANDAPIAHLVVEIKEEVEKLREQVQNIE